MRVRDLSKTLAFRLALRLTCVFFGCTLFLFALCFALLSHIEWKELDVELAEDAAELGELLTLDGIPGVLAELELEARSHGSEQMHLELRGVDGELLGQSDRTEWSGLDAALADALRGGPNEPYATAYINRYDRVRVYRHRFSSGEQLLVCYRLNNLDRFLRRTGIFFGLAAGAMTCLAGILGWRSTRTAMAGVKEVTQAASAISSGRFDARVPVGGWGSEIELLALVFNEMIERISRLMAELTEMGDNMAHDLRTPVSRIRAGAEQLLSLQAASGEAQIAAGEIIGECDRLLGFINTVLDMSEAEAGMIGVALQEIDLSPLVSEVVEFYQPAAEDKGLSLSVEAPSVLLFKCERQKFQRLLANLLDNAIKYTPRGGAVTVRVTAHNSQVELQVRDNGIGIPSKNLPHVFERFYRGDASRSIPGNGMGLAYVKVLARAWGGKVGLDSQEGSGVTVTVTLPNGAHAADPRSRIANR